jgi:hypothetical protein
MTPLRTTNIEIVPGRIRFRERRTFRRWLPAWVGRATGRTGGRAVYVRVWNRYWLITVTKGPVHHGHRR